VPIEFYPPQRKDADAVLWWQAVVAAGGTVSGVQLRHVSTLIRALKACGAWDRRDDYAAYCAENAIQARVTLKKRIVASFTSGTQPTFVANRGFLGQRSGAIDTGWNGTTAGQVYTQNDAGFGCYLYSAPTTDLDRVMGNDETNYGEFALTNAKANWSGGCNSSAAITYANGGLLTGLLLFNRTASNAVAMWQNGVQKVTSSTTSASIKNQSFYVCAGNNGNAPFQPTDAGISFAFFGGSLANVLLAAEWQAIRAFLTTVGVP